MDAVWQRLDNYGNIFTNPDETMDERSWALESLVDLADLHPGFLDGIRKTLTDFSELLKQELASRYGCPKSGFQIF